MVNDDVQSQASAPTDDREMLDGADQVELSSSKKPQIVDAILDNLLIKLESFQSRVNLVVNLNSTDEFKLLSKKSRNNLIYGMLDEVGDLEEITKVAFRALKKVRRERVPEDKIDEMLGVPVHIRNAVRGKSDDTES